MSEEDGTPTTAEIAAMCNADWEILTRRLGDTAPPAGMKYLWDLAWMAGAKAGIFMANEEWMRVTNGPAKPA